MDVVSEVKKQDGTVIVRAAGEVTINTSPDLHAQLIEVCNQTPKHLIVDLGKVSMIDSSGLGTLLEVLKRVRGMSGKMSIIGVNDPIRSVFEVTRMDQVFSIHASEEDALSS